MNEVNKVEEMSVIATIEIKNDQMVSPSRLF
jgi:chromosome segregation ATPase